MFRDRAGYAEETRARQLASHSLEEENRRLREDAESLQRSIEAMEMGLMSPEGVQMHLAALQKRVEHQRNLSKTISSGKIPAYAPHRPSAGLHHAVRQEDAHAAGDGGEGGGVPLSSATGWSRFQQPNAPSQNNPSQQQQQQPASDQAPAVADAAVRGRRRWTVDDIGGAHADKVADLLSRIIDQVKSPGATMDASAMQDSTINSQATSLMASKAVDTDHKFFASMYARASSGRTRTGRPALLLTPGAAAVGYDTGLIRRDNEKVDGVPRDALEQEMASLETEQDRVSLIQDTLSGLQRQWRQEEVAAGIANLPLAIAPHAEAGVRSIRKAIEERSNQTQRQSASKASTANPSLHAKASARRSASVAGEKLKAADRGAGDGREERKASPGDFSFNPPTASRSKVVDNPYLYDSDDDEEEEKKTSVIKPSAVEDQASDGSSVASCLRKLIKLMAGHPERIVGMIAQFDKGDKEYLTEEELVSFVEFFIEDSKVISELAAKAVFEACKGDRVTVNSETIFSYTSALAEKQQVEEGKGRGKGRGQEEEEEEEEVEEEYYEDPEMMVDAKSDAKRKWKNSVVADIIDDGPVHEDEDDRRRSRAANKASRASGSVTSASRRELKNLSALPQPPIVPLDPLEYVTYGSRVGVQIADVFRKASKPLPEFESSKAPYRTWMRVSYQMHAMDEANRPAEPDRDDDDEEEDEEEAGEDGEEDEDQEEEEEQEAEDYENEEAQDRRKRHTRARRDNKDSLARSARRNHGLDSDEEEEERQRREEEEEEAKKGGVTSLGSETMASRAREAAYEADEELEEEKRLKAQSQPPATPLPLLGGGVDASQADPSLPAASAPVEAHRSPEVQAKLERLFMQEGLMETALRSHPLHYGMAPALDLLLDRSLLPDATRTMSHANPTSPPPPTPLQQQQQHGSPQNTPMKSNYQSPRSATNSPTFYTPSPSPAATFSSIAAGSHGLSPTYLHIAGRTVRDRMLALEHAHAEMVLAGRKKTPPSYVQSDKRLKETGEYYELIAKKAREEEEEKAEREEMEALAHAADEVERTLARRDKFDPLDSSDEEEIKEVKVKRDPLDSSSSEDEEKEEKSSKSKAKGKKKKKAEGSKEKASVEEVKAASSVVEVEDVVETPPTPAAKRGNPTQAIPAAEATRSKAESKRKSSTEEVEEEEKEEVEEEIKARVPRMNEMEEGGDIAMAMAAPAAAPEKKVKKKEKPLEEEEEEVEVEEKRPGQKFLTDDATFVDRGGPGPDPVTDEYSDDD